MASYSTAVDVARLLIARGAEIDPVEANWSNTPLGAAVYGQHIPMIELLAPHSRENGMFELATLLRSRAD